MRMEANDGCTSPQTLMPGWMSVSARLPESDLVELAIPVNKLGYTFFYIRRWLVAYVTDQVIHIGVGGRHITRLHGQKVFYCLLAGPLFDNFYEAGQFDRVITADIVDAIRGLAGAWIGRCPTPLIIGLCHLIKSADNTLYNIVYICEITLVMAMVEHIDRLSRKNLLGEDKQRHIRSAPRAIDGEESKTSGW